MVAAALFLARLPSPPPVIRGWKKNDRAMYRVLESTGDEQKITVAYFIRLTVTEPGTLKADLSNRTVRLDGKRQPGLEPKLSRTFDYERIGPIQGTFDVEMGNGNPVVWALSAPGWGGTGFTGKREGDLWSGEALFGNSAGNATVRLRSQLGRDAWPRRVDFRLDGPRGTFLAEIVRV